MQPKIIELKQAPVILVELPEWANFYGYYDRYGYVIYHNPQGIKCESFVTMKESKLVGVLSDLTEEQFAECVNVYEVSESINIPKMRFYQMLESENVYTENPHEFPTTTDHKYYDEPYDGTGFYQELYSNDMVQWQEAQSRTIDPTRTVVLIKK